MNNAFKEIFGPIQAEEELKDRTRAFLAKQTGNYTGMPTVRRRYSVCAAACACLVFLLLGGRWLYFTPTVEISIDINPSIELSVNRFDRVIAVTGFNEDGQELSNSLKVKHKNYAEAIKQIINSDRITALLYDDEVMAITVIGADGQQSAKILSNVEMCTAGRHNTYCYFAHPEETAAVHETGLSHGKYRAFLELKLLDPDITPETVQGMTMKEIRELINSLSADGENGASSSNDPGNGRHSHGGGHGHRQRNGKPENPDTRE